MADAILPHSGIYAIRNTVNNKRYVGQSANMAGRKRQHLRSLRTGDHHCVALQRAFNKYGEATFVHEALELCERAEITEREQHWIDHFKSTGIYNTALAAGSPLGIKRSPESIAKMAAAKTGAKASEKTKQKMRESQARAKELKRAKALAQWARPGESLKMSAIRKGRVTSEATREKLSAGLVERWSDPSYKARVAASGRAAQAKVAAKTSERMRAKWADPEFRKKMELAHQERKQQRAVDQHHS